MQQKEKAFINEFFRSTFLYTEGIEACKSLGWHKNKTVAEKSLNVQTKLSLQSSDKFHLNKGS